MQGAAGAHVGGVDSRRGGRVTADRREGADRC